MGKFNNTFGFISKSILIIGLMILFYKLIFTDYVIDNNVGFIALSSIILICTELIIKEIKKHK